MRYIKVILGCVLLALREAAAVESGPGYLLNTRRNQNTPQRIDPDVESLLRSSFYAADPIVVSIPRWGSNGSVEHLILATALLERNACNFFAVDLAETQTESEIVASVSGLLVMLHRQFDVPLGRQQLIGFGAGAHLAGGAAEQVQQQLNEQLPLITALDPSGDSEQLKHQLAAGDALRVEVIHTNSQGLGSIRRLGDVDYYPNGGQQQPGCNSDACSHERALNLAVEMWSPANEFLVAQCGSVETMSAKDCRWSAQRMGSNSAAGIYFLETRSSSPYGRGAYHIGFF
ncbi:GH24627 [Drosophila grimshawi]|uniref:GH24627 n=1 Tax=Drosophila grimshawi TaxID=7222 RepID=B4K1D5_DROGR|nr:GH24627 [Drosophila grimshawi]